MIELLRKLFKKEKDDMAIIKEDLLRIIKGVVEEKIDKTNYEYSYQIMRSNSYKTGDVDYYIISISHNQMIDTGAFKFPGRADYSVDIEVYVKDSVIHLKRIDDRFTSSIDRLESEAHYSNNNVRLTHTEHQDLLELLDSWCSRKSQQEEDSVKYFSRLFEDLA